MKALDGSLIHQVLLDGSIFGGDYDGRLGPLTNWINLNSHLFRGKTVLDLGSNAGHFPIEYVRAGAKKVIAVEGRPEFAEQWEEFKRNCIFDLSRVEWQTADVRDVAINEPVDIISCLGLLYHVEGFLPRLSELSLGANLMLVEMQIAESNATRIEKPEDRTMSINEEKVLHFTSNLWERLLQRDYGADYMISRIWQLAYGDLIQVEHLGRRGFNTALTMRAFYVLAKKGLDIHCLYNTRTGCRDIMDQEFLDIDDAQP